MSDPPRRLPGDLAEDVDPIGFAVRFTRAMRRHRSAVHRPSLRTSVAIPRWLTARCLRTGGLTPLDYVTAAVRCTPPEDQDLAEAVARSLVFPERHASDASAPGSGAPTAAVGDADPLASILGDLAALDVDLDRLDSLGSVDEALAAADEAMGAFDLFERLYSSADPAERALGELIRMFGGPAELEADGVRTTLLARVWVARRLLAAVGELTPEMVSHGHVAGYGPDLTRACTEPWELAGVLAAAADPALDQLLDDLLSGALARELGRTLAFLAPHPGVAARRARFAEAALARALHLSDHAELVVGLGDWVDPPPDLVTASVAVNPRRALEAAGWLEEQLGIDLRPAVFEAWLATQPAPNLGQLAVMAAPCDAWTEALARALPRDVATLDGPAPASPAAPVHRRFEDAVDLARVLRECPLEPAPQIASELCTEAMVRIPVAPWFLVVLDAFLAHRVLPRLDPVLARARALGISDGEVLDRLGEAFEQLRQLILDNQADATRYRRLVAKVSFVPPETMQALCAQAAQAGNLAAMAALLAVDLGGAAQHLDDDNVIAALGHKGIGGGPNLLRQWFAHRGTLRREVRGVIKAQARAALLDVSLEWSGQGGGSGAQGLVPQQRARPFRPGDGLDALDLESTLEAIVVSGKSLSEVTADDLYASETSRGQAALAVLIDISGSMGPSELTMCAIAVVMLLGRLLPEELALAVFESDTHVLKEFDDPADLDAVADQVLELSARGGTRVDAALRWAHDAFAAAPEADVRVLFLLSDFAFAEPEPLLQERGAALRDTGVQLLAASHGWVDEARLEALRGVVGGEHLDMRRLDRLPAMLLECLARIAR